MSRIRIAALCLIAFSCASSCSIVPDRVYQPVCPAGACGDPPARTAALERATAPQTHTVTTLGWKSKAVAQQLDPTRVPVTYYKAWLEYKEDGGPHDSLQLTAIKNRIESLNRQGTPLLTVIYVHGWHNNADTKEKPEYYDSIAFDDLMARSVDSTRRLFHRANRAQVPNVLGVYVGWRGESTTAPLLTVLSIGNRSNAADRLGMGRSANPQLAGDLRSDLQEIADTARAGHALNRVLLIGHSFGGRVLTSAFVSDFEQHPSYVLNDRVLLATVNAALSADCFEGAWEKNTPKAVPTWINVTSADDFATRKFYRRAYKVGLVRPCGRRGPAAAATIGHYAPYVTDQLYFRAPMMGRVSPELGRFSLKDGRSEAGLIDLLAPWTCQPMQGFVAYPHFDRNAQGLPPNRRYDYRSSDIYSVEIRPSCPQDRPMAMRTVLTDRNTIGHATDEAGKNDVHNAFVSTNLIRLLVETLYASEFERDLTGRGTVLAQ